MHSSVTLYGDILARSVVFSLLVCDTQITCSVFLRLIFSSLFVRMALTSEKPNIEWSVKTPFSAHHHSKVAT